jgi:hypothetical protein
VARCEHPVHDGKRLVHSRSTDPLIVIALDEKWGQSAWVAVEPQVSLAVPDEPETVVVCRMGHCQALDAGVWMGAPDLGQEAVQLRNLGSHEVTIGGATDQIRCQVS